MFSNDQLQKMMATAYLKALKSPDPSSQNGALIVERQVDGDFRVISYGYNHFYDGVPGQVEPREEKYRQIQHAERDAVVQAARRGECTQGRIMVCPWAACEPCALEIIGSGLAALVVHKQRCELTDRHWVSKVSDAITWIQNAGIALYEYDGAVPGTKPILVSGKLWSPAGLDYVAN